jgi:hypothetical protein
MSDNILVQTEGTNLAFVEENKLGASTPPTTGWWNVQPNSFGTYGPSFKKDPRDPISKNAQLQKGMLTDMDSGIQIEVDLTRHHVERFAPGIFRCVAKVPGNTGKAVFFPTAVTGTGFTVDGLGALGQHYLVSSRGFNEEANNGLKELGAGSTNTEIKTAGLEASTDVPSNAEVALAGYRGASGSIKLDSDGNITSVSEDFTTWGLNKFQWVSVGDPNDATHSFDNPDFVGPVRLRKIEAHKLTLDRRSWVVGQKSYLDLGTVATNLDSVIEAQTVGPGGDALTVAVVDDGDAAVKASLNLATKTAHVNTVIQARTPGTDGNAITVEITAGAPTAAGVLTEVGTNVKLQIKTTATATTVGDLETLIGTSTLIQVKTAGTSGTSLDGTDVFASSALSGGTAADPVSIVEVGSATTIHITGGSSTVADVEAAIASDSTLIEVKTPGTPGAILVHTNDEFAATNLAHGADGTDTAVGKRVDIYFGPWYRNVATDHPDYRTPSYAFEIAYQTLYNGSPGYHYLLGNMVDECKWNLPLTAKSTMSLKFVGLKTLNPTPTRKTGPADARDANSNEGVSTSTDLQRLRLTDVDELGLSTDFTNVTITSSNGISTQKQLATLGGKFMNIGHHKEMLDASCIFTSDAMIRAVRDNRSCSLDVMLRNSDFGALYDLNSLTLDSNDYKLERDKAVILDNKGSGFQDPLSGSTASLSTFPYLPPLLADDTE